jgi:hypothetical protein
MKRTFALLLKFGVTLGIFVAIFLEFGGGYRAVDTAKLRAPDAFEASNPAYPGIVSRIRARLRGATLPPARVPVGIDDVCVAAAERNVFVRLADGTVRRFKPLRHCGDGGFTTLYARAADGSFTPVPIGDAPAEAYVRIQGFQLVPAELSELWSEVRNLRLSVFLPWFIAAMLVKLLGIFANVWRWQILLRGQGIELGFGYLTNTYFIGRYFGIVTPSTMGLDAWRLYETIRLTRRPVECATVLVVERVLGMVGPLHGDPPLHADGGAHHARPVVRRARGGDGTAHRRDDDLRPADPPSTELVPRPGSGLSRASPPLRRERDRRSDRVCRPPGVSPPRARTRGLRSDHDDAHVLRKRDVARHPERARERGAVRVGGDDVRHVRRAIRLRGGGPELVFVWLLGSKAGAVKAFLIGNLGFWIEKIPLSVPGGLILLLRRDPSIHAVTREDLGTGAARGGGSAPDGVGRLTPRTTVETHFLHWPRACV